MISVKPTNLFVARREHDMVKRTFNENMKNLQSLESSRSDRLRRFGEKVPALLVAIEEAHRRGQFKCKPRGPLGKKPALPKSYIGLIWAH